MITWIFLLVTAPIWLLCLLGVASQMLLAPFSETGMLYWLLTLVAFGTLWLARHSRRA